MIGWSDVYKVVAAMAPLYFALGLGYGSVRWWKLFTPDQCDAINRLVAYFAIPFFAFDFSARIDPFALNYRVLAADALSKLAVALALAAWAASTRCCRCFGAKRGGATVASSWCITGFSLATLNNTLVVGVPLLDAMYGEWARDLVVQISVVQIIVYFPLLLLAFEARGASSGAAKAEAAAPASDVEDGVQGRRRESLWPVVKTVGLKVARNPNVYAGVLGVAWSCVTNRWHIETPSIIEGSVLIMSRTSRTRHVQHGSIHGAAGEGHRLRRRPDRARHGAAVRRRPGGHRRRSPRPGAPRRRATPRHHTGCTSSVHHYVRVREGVRSARRCAQHRGYIWNIGVVARVNRILYRSRIHWIV